MLLDVLRQLSECGATATPRLREALLAEGSATPDNVEAAQHLEYGDYGTAVRLRGLKLTDVDAGLSDLFNDLEGTPIPAALSQTWPTLTQPKWDAALRTVVLLLASLETRPH